MATAPAALLFDLPRSVPVPLLDGLSPPSRSRAFAGWHLIERLPVPPRRHDQRARWRPAEMRYCLPWLRDEVELDAWLATQRVGPGEVAAYHCGHFARDREQDPRLDLLARADCPSPSDRSLR